MLHNIIMTAGQEKGQVRLPGSSKVCPWEIENGSLVVP